MEQIEIILLKQKCLKQALSLRVGIKGVVDSGLQSRIAKVFTAIIDFL